MSETKKVCGIVMPISEIDGLPTSHWKDVLNIVEVAAKDAGFSARLVSDTFESNLIHKEILQNIYNDDIVICDVSGRNPNVFFELGIRMATQKPTVIIKDDMTQYPFDTGPNRYIGYPRDLRHPKMEAFRIELVAALEKSSEHSKENSFIGQLGPFQIPEVESKELPVGDIILQRLERLDRKLVSVAARASNNRIINDPRERAETFRWTKIGAKTVEVFIRSYFNTSVDNAISDILKTDAYCDLEISVKHLSSDHSHVKINGDAINERRFKADFESSVENAIPF